MSHPGPGSRGLPAVAVLLATVGAIGLLMSARPKARPGVASTTTSAPARSVASRPTSYQVGQAELTVTDPGRKALVGGAYVARTLQTTVWYPQGSPGARFPLVVFAPGYLQCPEQYAPLLHSWASAGYVVAAIRFPATNCSSAPGDEGDILNQPADVELVTTRLIGGATGTPADGEVDPAEVAVAGHSDGGDVAAAVGAGSCCRDPRVAATIVLAGAELSSFGGTYFPSGSPPLLVVQGTADSVNPPSAGHALYAADGAGPRWLLSLTGGAHFPPYQASGPYEQVVARVTIDFLRLVLYRDNTAGARMAVDGNATGLASIISG